MTSAVIQIEGVSRCFEEKKQQRAVLARIDLSVEPGQLIALVGASGSGKTTLLNIIGALDPDFEGKVTLFGRPLRALDDDARCELRNQHIGFVFQSFHLLEHLTVADNVRIPLWLRQKLLTVDEEIERVREALSLVGLGDRLHDSVKPLSGGERQRVAIARATVHRPSLLLADEPTGNLDSTTGETIFDLFDRIRKAEARSAVVVATHDRALAARADRVLTLEAGVLT